MLHSEFIKSFRNNVFVTKRKKDDVGLCRRFAAEEYRITLSIIIFSYTLLTLVRFGGSLM
jgi:hypothetical protein